MEKNVSVGLIRCPDYQKEALDRAVDFLFQALDLDRFVHPGDRVLIKPNLIIRRDAEAATTTHPAVVAAIARRLKKQGVDDLLIAESGGGPYTASLLKHLYAGTGFAQMAEEEGIALNYDIAERTKACPDGKRVKSFDLIAPCFDADVIINVPKLKSHCMMGLSAAVKNLFGFVAGLKKPELHCRFPDEAEFGQMIVDLCETVRPTFSIVDAVTCMEGDGPTGGSPRFGGMLLASADAYRLDRVCVELIEMNRNRVAYLSDAIERGLCPEKVEDIELIGGALEEFILHGFKQPRTKSVDFIERLPKFTRKFVTKTLTPKPAVVRGKCIGCGKCAQSCPQHVIDMERREARIRYPDCIRCYCCHEMCPEKAIRIRRFGLFDW